MRRRQLKTLALAAKERQDLQERDRLVIIWKMMDAWHLEWHVSHGMALPECFCNRDAMVRPGFTAKLKNFLLTKGIRCDDWKLTLPRRFHSIISQRAPRAASTKDERLAGGLRASPRAGDRLQAGRRVELSIFSDAPTRARGFADTPSTAAVPR